MAIQPTKTGLNIGTQIQSLRSLTPQVSNVASNAAEALSRIQDAVNQIARIQQNVESSTATAATAAVTGFLTVTPDGSNNVTVDLALATSFCLVLSATAVTILAPIDSSTALTAGSRIWVYLEQDATGGRAVPTFSTASGGFTADPDLQQLGGDPSTRTKYEFVYDGTGWQLDSIKEGIVKP